MLYASIAVVVACETMFSAVVPTMLSAQTHAAPTLVGLVVGVALGCGLAAVPFVVPWVRCGRSSVVLVVGGALLLIAGPLCSLASALPIGVTASAALVFGVGRAVAMLVLLVEVGRLGPQSRGHGHNGAAQRMGSAAGALVAAVVLGSGINEVGTGALACGGVVVIVLACMRPRAAVAAPSSPRAAVQAIRLLRRDGRVLAALLVNVLVWVCVFVGNTMVPVGLVHDGRSVRESGFAVLAVLLVRDMVAVLVGLFGWTILRRVPPGRLVVTVGVLAAMASAVVVASNFALVGLVVSGALLGCCIALGIACSNVVATSGGGDLVEWRLAASQSAAGLPIAVAAVSLVLVMQSLGADGALSVSAVLVLLVAVGAGVSLSRSATGRSALLSDVY